MKKEIIIALIAIFIISLLRVIPVVIKDYPPSAIYENMALARNLSLQHVYGIESVKNVFLSSIRVADEGMRSDLGNKLTPILYAGLFSLFGVNYSLPPLVMSLLFAAVSVVLFLITLRLFGFWPAVLFSAVSVFMPANWRGTLMFGFYEFALFFFTLGLLIYFSPVARASAETKSDNKRSWWINYRWLILAGILLGLAALSRNALLISTLPLIAFDFYKNRSYQRLLALALPLLIVVNGFFFVDMMRGNANYYFSNRPESFTTYGHLFPDPYTYHLRHDEYIASAIKITDPDIVEFLAKYGYPVSFKSQLLVLANSLIFYPKNLLWPTTFAGPIIIFLMVLGALHLRRQKYDLFKYFFWFWLPFWYFTLIILKTNNWDHFLEIQWPLGLLVVMGIYYSINWIKDRWADPAKQKFAYIVLGAVIVSQIGLSASWMLRESYMTSSLPGYADLIQKVRTAKNLNDSDIIAVGIHPSMPETLNYYTDKNFIYFHPDTIQQLLREQKLMTAFQFFGVTKTVGFDKNLAREIFEKTAAVEL